MATPEEIAAIVAKVIADMEARNSGGPVPLPSAPVGDYYFLPANPGPDGVGGSNFRHKYDIGRANRTVSTPFDADWPELYRARPFVYVPLTQQRRELGSYMRWGGVPQQPTWFDAVLSARTYNAGIDRRIEELQLEIAELNARRA